MSFEHNGGPAFPLAQAREDFAEPGMNLRDWFAGQALAGLLANANLMDHLNAGDNALSETAFAASVARGAYVYADALLEARK